MIATEINLTQSRWIIGIHNGFDVDDFYVHAENEQEAVEKALAMAGGGTVSAVLPPVYMRGAS